MGDDDDDDDDEDDNDNDNNDDDDDDDDDNGHDDDNNEDGGCGGRDGHHWMRKGRGQKTQQSNRSQKRVGETVVTALTMTMTMTMTQQQGRHYCSGDSAEEGCGSGGAGGKETVTSS